MRKAADPFDKLLAQSMKPEFGHYRPIVGYLYSRGTVRRFSSDQTTWLSLDRAIATCFGSAAKRLRGTWDADYNRLGRVTAILMMVTDMQGAIIWKLQVELPELLGGG